MFFSCIALAPGCSCYGAGSPQVLTTVGVDRALSHCPKDIRGPARVSQEFGIDWYYGFKAERQSERCRLDTGFETCVISLEDALQLCIPVGLVVVDYLFQNILQRFIG